MHFNWGTGIALFFTCFAVTMVFAVVRTTYYRPQMVQADYYALDLDYQARLEKKQNAAMLTEAPQVHLTAGKDSIRVVLPGGMSASAGKVNCYRSATTRDDFSVKFNNTNALSIPAANLTSGRWHVELDWTAADGKPYYFTTAIYVP